MVPLLFLVGLSALQVILLAHAQAVVRAAAAEGARVAAVAAQPVPAGRDTVRDVIGRGLGDVAIGGVDVRSVMLRGLPVVEVEVVARPRLFLLPDVVQVRSTGRALAAS